MKSATAHSPPSSQSCNCSLSRPLDARKRTTSESSESAEIDREGGEGRRLRPRREEARGVLDVVALQVAFDQRLQDRADAR